MSMNNYPFEFAPYNGATIVHCNMVSDLVATACKQRGEHGRTA